MHSSSSLATRVVRCLDGANLIKEGKTTSISHAVIKRFYVNANIWKQFSAFMARAAIGRSGESVATLLIGVYDESSLGNGCRCRRGGKHFHPRMCLPKLLPQPDENCFSLRSALRRTLRRSSEDSLRRQHCFSADPFQNVKLRKLHKLYSEHKETIPRRSANGKKYFFMHLW